MNTIRVKSAWARQGRLFCMTEDGVTYLHKVKWYREGVNDMVRRVHARGTIDPRYWEVEDPYPKGDHGVKGSS